LIRTYPWDAGTDAGDSYTAVDHELDPPQGVFRITPDNAPNGIFVSPNGKEVLPVAEWQCVLHTCDAGVPAKDCHKSNWPPANGCDLLKYPGCDESYCDPDTDSPCQACKPKEYDDGAVVFYPDCCQSNHEPMIGSCQINEVTDMPVAATFVPTRSPVPPLCKHVNATKDAHRHRLLQWADENLPDSNVCRAAGSRFECQISNRISSEDEAYTDVDFTVNCHLDLQTAFDYRQSQSCTCTAKMVSSDPSKPEKICPCSVYPLGFGRNPINIDWLLAERRRPLYYRYLQQLGL